MRTVAAICRELIPPADRRSDSELVAAFAAGPSEEAFAELLRRHGPLVWGACRRLLPDPADAEDAFQAAFLVLVRRKARIAHGTALGPWLYRVAVWTARNVRRKNARRLARQSALPDQLSAPPAPDPTVRLDLDAALLALPARYRDPVVLCHLAGLSRTEAAAQLGCPEGTLSARLSRGLTKLRARLGAFEPARVAAVAVPALLVATTARSAVAATAAAAAVPPAIGSLVEGVLHMFWVKKATAAVFALCAVFALGVGAGFGTRTERAAAGAQEKAAADPRPKETRDLDKEIKTAEAIAETALLALTGTRQEAKVARDKVNELKVKLTPEKAKLEELLAAMNALERLEQRAAAAEATLAAARAKLEALRAQKAAPRDFDKEIKELETAMKAGAAALAFLREELQLAKNLVAKLAGVKGGGPDQQLEARRAALALAKADGDVATATERFQVQAEKLVRLKFERAAAAGKPLEPKTEIEALEKQTLKLELVHKLQEVTLVKEEATLQHLRITNADAKDQSNAAIAVSEAQIALRATAAELEVLKVQIVLLNRKAANTGYIELTITGTAGKFSFTLYEVLTDDGKQRGTVRKFGPVTTTDADMLTKLLTRARADATAPKVLRVIAEPPTALGVGPHSALKACAAAGYDAVTFTGYVPLGGYLAELPPNPKGNVPGYFFYDSKEVKPAEVAKDIEEGLRRL
jgi:RNA polymerase sigma factor (sigma-70 family)